MVANPVQFMDPICQSLLRRTPLNVRTGFTYRQRLALSWLVTTMMRIGHTSAPHADRVGQFVLDHFLADQEDNPQTLPQLVMQNVIENLPMLVPMIRNGDLVRKLDRSVDALCRANFPRISEKAKMAKTRMVRAFHARGSSNK
jgi:hypothetical protein